MSDLQGWLPPDERDDDQTRLNDEFLEQCGTFGSVGMDVGDLPERVIFAELQKKHLGKLIPRIKQLTGSCVGAGAAQAYANSALGDVVHRGDHEEVKLCYPWATYGVGRKLAGMRGRGSGSFGSAQARAVSPEHFGMLAIDDPRVPKPSYTDNGTWVQWSRNVELQWSHPSGWPVKRDELDDTSTRYAVHTVTKVESTGQWKQLLAQGYGVTLASSFGTRPSVKGDVLIGPWNASWAHQMSSSGYWQHPKHGDLFLIDNQWGPGAHGSCPTLSKFGVYGSFWMREKDAQRIIDSRHGEVFGHSSTGGFPARQINWSGVMGFRD